MADEDPDAEEMAQTIEVEEAKVEVEHDTISLQVT
jgi:hypothetical protein